LAIFKNFFLPAPGGTPEARKLAAIRADWLPQAAPRATRTATVANEHLQCDSEAPGDCQGNNMQQVSVYAVHRRHENSHIRPVYCQDGECLPG
jgi:hypothetical protein